MKSLRGFGKKYFTLSSILAYAVSQTLHNNVLRLKNYELFKILTSSKDEEDTPPDEELNVLACSLFQSKPCHCDCYFKRKTKLAVKLFKFIPRCPFYCTFFAFRRTGVHPPTF